MILDGKPCVVLHVSFSTVMFFAHRKEVFDGSMPVIRPGNPMVEGFVRFLASWHSAYISFQENNRSFHLLRPFVGVNKSVMLLLRRWQSKALFRVRTDKSLISVSPVVGVPFAALWAPIIPFHMSVPDGGWMREESIDQSRMAPSIIAEALSFPRRFPHSTPIYHIL